MTNATSAMSERESQPYAKPSAIADLPVLGEEQLDRVAAAAGCDADFSFKGSYSKTIEVDTKNGTFKTETKAEVTEATASFHDGDNGTTENTAQNTTQSPDGGGACQASDHYDEAAQVCWAGNTCGGS